jgi:hypothetical protein
VPLHARPGSCWNHPAVCRDHPATIGPGPECSRTRQTSPPHAHCLGLSNILLQLQLAPLQLQLQFTYLQLQVLLARLGCGKAQGLARATSPQPAARPGQSCCRGKRTCLFHHPSLLVCLGTEAHTPALAPFLFIPPSPSLPSSSGLEASSAVLRSVCPGCWKFCCVRCRAVMLSIAAMFLGLAYCQAWAPSLCSILDHVPSHLRLVSCC